VHGERGRGEGTDQDSRSSLLTENQKGVVARCHGWTSERLRSVFETIGVVHSVEKRGWRVEKALKKKKGEKLKGGGTVIDKMVSLGTFDSKERRGS